MTMPNERTRSILATRQFLFSLLDKAKTPRVPKAIRDRAYQLLKHYPFDMYMQQVSEVAPEIFGSVDLFEANEYYTKARGKKAYAKK